MCIKNVYIFKQIILFIICSYKSELKNTSMVCIEIKKKKVKTACSIYKRKSSG